MAKYFKSSEIVGLHPRLVEKLDMARDIAGIPFHITEGFASGGSHVSNTAHARGLAVDLACKDAVSRMKMVTALLAVGFRRIGVYNLHLHADIDLSLPQDVMWWDKSS